MAAAVQEDRVRILRMVAEGKVSPEEAEDLLGALDQPPSEETRVISGPFDSPRLARPPRPNGRRKLVIRVTEDGEQRVNVQIPLTLLKAARHLVPRSVQEQLDEFDIKLDDLFQTLASEDGEGILVQVQDDDNQVMICVE